MALMVLQYAIMSALLVLSVAWFMAQSLRRQNLPPDSDDGNGGTGGGALPVIDVPPGARLTDLLVDRWPETIDLKKPEVVN